MEETGGGRKEEGWFEWGRCTLWPKGIVDINLITTRLR